VSFSDAADEALFRVVVIVGHSLFEQGAELHGGGSEYLYNKRIAELMFSYARANYASLDLRLVFRDGIGMSGAYAEAARLEPDACLELHFNAANTRARGTETLCSPDAVDREFAAVVQEAACAVFERGGLSRGVKVLSRGARGARNVYALPGYANCLIEPFFGDNAEDAALALTKQGEYAGLLVDVIFQWCQLRLT